MGDSKRQQGQDQLFPSLTAPSQPKEDKDSPSSHNSTVSQLQPLRHKESKNTTGNNWDIRFFLRGAIRESNGVRSVSPVTTVSVEPLVVSSSPCPPTNATTSSEKDGTDSKRPPIPPLKPLMERISSGHLSRTKMHYKRVGRFSPSFLPFTSPFSRVTHTYQPTSEQFIARCGISPSSAILSPLSLETKSVPLTPHPTLTFNTNSVPPSILSSPSFSGISSTPLTPRCTFASAPKKVFQATNTAFLLPLSTERQQLSQSSHSSAAPSLSGSSASYTNSSQTSVLSSVTSKQNAPQTKFSYKDLDTEEIKKFAKTASENIKDDAELQKVATEIIRRSQINAYCNEYQDIVNIFSYSVVLAVRDLPNAAELTSAEKEFIATVAQEIKNEQKLASRS